ncbi:hypothetical protein DFH06DRAFT_1119592 [Mycena polygramma]|nr:hypothetical protein DFH06DRAFT_1119592 [Mycena polygramma]
MTGTALPAPQWPTHPETVSAGRTRHIKATYSAKCGMVVAAAQSVSPECYSTSCCSLRAVSRVFLACLRAGAAFNLHLAMYLVVDSYDAIQRASHFFCHMHLDGRPVRTNNFDVRRQVRHKRRRCRTAEDNSLIGGLRLRRKTQSSGLRAASAQHGNQPLACERPPPRRDDSRGGARRLVYDGVRPSRETTTAPAGAHSENPNWKPTSAANVTASVGKAPGVWIRHLSSPQAFEMLTY